VLQHLFRLVHVGGGHGGVVVGGEDRATVREDDRVDVDVDDPRVGGDLLRDLVGVPGRRQAGPDVDELPDPLPGHVPHGTPQERAVLLGELTDLGHRLGDALDGLPVDPVVVLAPEVVVIHPGHAGPGGVDAGGPGVALPLDDRASVRFVRRRGAPEGERFPCRRGRTC
jgi:hypothetical protein